LGLCDKNVDVQSRRRFSYEKPACAPDRLECTGTIVETGMADAESHRSGRTTIGSWGSQCAALIAALTIGSVLHAADSPAHPDLSGLWQLRDDSKQVPPSALTAGAQAIAREERARQAAGEIVIPASRWCHPLGVPFVMGDSAPLDIAQSKFEVAIMAEVQSSARHIYIDGRPHVDMKDFDPTTTGNSIGHWEGRTLVVDTIGFNDRGNTSIPGGGHRGLNSHLVEHYLLDEAGNALRVQFTWTDPGVFSQPHSYEFTYHRAPPGSISLEYFCDASDPARGRN
jgi:hypothetical protein